MIVMITHMYYRVLVQKRIAAFFVSPSGSQFVLINAFLPPCCNTSTTPPLGLRQNRDDDKKSHSRKRRRMVCLQQEGPRVFVVVFFPAQERERQHKASHRGQNSTSSPRRSSPTPLLLKQLGRVISVPQSHERFILLGSLLHAPDVVGIGPFLVSTP